MAGNSKSLIVAFCLCIASELVAGEAGSTVSFGSDEVKADHFELHVRPILIDRCSECHGEQTQWNNLRVDSLHRLIKGGDSGPAIDPGNPENSLLIAAVQRTAKFPMPPDEPLSAEEVQNLIQWVSEGAYWPDEDVPATNDHVSHWAFQPIEEPIPPMEVMNDWVRNEIDLFVLQQLNDAGLEPAPEADRRTLLKRTSYDLTGLPANINEGDHEIRQDDADWLHNWTEQLLASPAYGEHWARLWLDVARFSDTKGYVYAREQKAFIHSHVYRDWVIDALSRDLPYNEFLQLQLAADLITPPGDPDRAAMGFLTLGRRFIGVSHDIIDDRIDVVSRGLMGLTVTCARCHDHKYDPIPTKDYYALYGVFLNSTEVRERLDAPVAEVAQGEWQQEMDKRQSAFDEALALARSTASQRMRERIVDYLVAQTEIEKYPQEGFDQILAVNDLIPGLVRRLQQALLKSKLQNDSRFYAWHRFTEIPKDDFSSQIELVWKEVQTAPDDICHPIAGDLFPTAPDSVYQVAEAYGQFMVKEGEELFRDFMSGPESPFEIPDELMYGIEGLFDSGTCDQLWKLQNEIDQWIIANENSPSFAMCLSNRAGDYLSQVFLRGNPATRGDVVARHMLSLVSDEEQSFNKGEERLELSNEITSPSNPLTARVWVNRIWRQYFGEGLVRTPSDFGLRAEAPSHPRLLDWLTSQLVKSNWSTKSIHRLILNSATYRQSSIAKQTDEMREIGGRVDPENRLLWYMPRRRLTFEAMRDSLLSASGDLTNSVGGRPAELFPAAQVPARRTIYSFIDRQFVPSVLRVFDYANPDMHAAKRNATVVPQQSLFLLNHPFVALRAKNLVASLRSNENAEKIEELYLRVLKRLPSDKEIELAKQFIDFNTDETILDVPETALAWSYGTAELSLKSDAQRDSVKLGEVMIGDAQIDAFTALPYFNGTSWQGGERYPDDKLGWAQLTATGGHPGNDLDHAIVRRWTAPASLGIRIESLLNHEESVGDGVRGWIISQRQGVLAMGLVHNNRWQWNRDALHVEAGEHLDFVIDINNILNTDQFLWQIKIVIVDADGGTNEWDSVRDFMGPRPRRLTLWEQLAHVLLISNEAMTVD